MGLKATFLRLEIDCNTSEPSLLNNNKVALDKTFRTISISPQAFWNVNYSQRTNLHVKNFQKFTKCGGFWAMRTKWHLLTSWLSLG